MSAETIHEHQPAAFDHPEAAGSLAMGTTVSQPETVGGQPVLVLHSASPDKGSIRSRAMIATKIKEKFQSVTGDTADERDTQRQRAREYGVRVMFKTFGQLPTGEGADEAFGELYRATETRIATASSDERVALWDHVSEAWDTHADHPVMLTLDSVRSMSTVDPEDILHMRRTALLLIADHTDD